MASTPAGRRRTVCETCELPFYANARTCPYCGAAHGDDGNGGFVFEASSRGERTRCSTCGLPYYDGTEACPYCERADGPTPVAETPDGPTEPASVPDERSGLFGRIKRTLGF